MSSSFGWTSWGWVNWSGGGEFRVWKHYTGPLIAVHSSYEGDAPLLLFNMHDALLNEAGIEPAPTAADVAQGQRDKLERQAVHDMAEAITRLDAENAELRRQLASSREVVAQ